MSPAAVSVGTFDGVHRGHRRLLADAAERAKAVGLDLVVLTLDRHPLGLLRPERAPRLLTGLDHKLELLAGVDGVARVEVLAFDRPRADQTASSFVRDTLVGQLDARLLVVGGNFRFGRGGAGDVALAERLGRTVGLEVVGIALLEGSPGSVISSSEIRRLVAAGHLAKAAALLGRAHEVRGELRVPPVPGGHGHTVPGRPAPAGRSGGAGVLHLVFDEPLLLPPPGGHSAVVAPLVPPAPGVPGTAATVEVAGEVDGPSAGGASVTVRPLVHPLPDWWRPGAQARVTFPGDGRAPAPSPGGAEVAGEARRPGRDGVEAGAEGADRKALNR